MDRVRGTAVFDGKGMLFIPDSLVPENSTIDALLASAGVVERDRPRTG